jgi:NAD(P)-dependent dehydrogenase (short-subunit alcohol dehydrogenase family)
LALPAQGYLFGRGNQPIGDRVTERVGRDNNIVIETNAKRRGLSARSPVEEENMSKVIAVTGATAGMGKECVERLSGRGHRVYGTVYGIDMDPEWKNLPYTLIPCDITDQSSVEAFYAKIQQKEKRIDVLVNCAGFGFEGSVEDTTVEEAKFQFEVNLFGTHRMIREVMPIMRGQGGGKIITISSLAAQFPSIPYSGFYSMSKKAVDGLVEALRVEGKPFGIQATSINPGDMKTDFTASRVRAAALKPGSPHYERAMKSIEAGKKSELSSQGPEVVGRLVCSLVDAEKLKPKYFIEPKYKVLLVLARFLSNSRLEKLMESIYS